MASKKVELHENAALEYEAAVEWYLERSVLAASKFVDAISRGMEMIVEAPHRWPAGNHGTRRFLLQRFPFAIVYREIPAAIQVLAIAHPVETPVIGSNACERALTGLSRVGYLLHRDGLQHADPAALAFVAGNDQLQRSMVLVQWFAVGQVCNDDLFASEIAIQFRERKQRAIAVARVRHNEERHVLPANFVALRHAGLGQQRLQRHAFIFARHAVVIFRGNLHARHGLQVRRRQVQLLLDFTFDHEARRIGRD